VIGEAAVLVEAEAIVEIAAAEVEGLPYEKLAQVFLGHRAGALDER
jgi:hypothetical protein